MAETEPVSSLYCTKCQQPLPLFIFRKSDFRPCPSCGVKIWGIIFPAFTRGDSSSRSAQMLMDDTDASCFYHLQKKAEIACDYCGRFLCALCDIEMDGKHLCAPCIETGQQKGRIKTLESRRTLYDSVALSLSILPLLIFYLTIITAPIALYIAFRYWNAPTSILHRGKWRLIVAVLFASLEIVGWAAIGYFLITSFV
jgi:hypothetical protein